MMDLKGVKTIINTHWRIILIVGGVLIVLLALILGLSIGLTANRSLKRARSFLEKHQLIDGHNDLSYMIRENFENRFDKFDLNDMTKWIEPNVITHTDILRLKKGKLGGQFWAVYADCETLAKDAARIHLEQLDTLKRLFSKYPDTFQFTGTAKEVREAFQNKKIASLFGLESGHAIDSSLGLLRVFYDLGVRYMTLTHNCNTPWAGNNLVDVNGVSQVGLNAFGKTVVKEMNRIGMIVDLSHVSYQTMIDALTETKAPVMFSHSSVFYLCNHTRNVRDDILQRVKQNNGVVMINFYNNFITCKDVATIDDVRHHINYVRDLIGVDHVGIGADYDGVGRTPKYLEDVSNYPDLFASLIDDGWSDSDMEKLAGGNILRVLEQVEQVSMQMNNLTPFDEIIDASLLNDGKFNQCRTSF